MQEKVWWFIDPAIHQMWAMDNLNSRLMSIGRSPMTTRDGANELETPDSKQKGKAMNFANSAMAITPTIANKEELKHSSSST